ncbi:hypothetical protein KM043_009967 [Ampulex compressa]|nr:hypothetical protein KM043_009967 [Ampulex compressa]
MSAYLLLLLSCAKCISGLYESAPHIIVIMADDLGWNDVGFHGSNQISTPNIDALGYNGIILNKHYVLPSSTPSRAAFFSGLYPIRIGMQGDGIRGGEPRGLPVDIRILPEYLSVLGYTTKLIGKWHLGYHTAQHTPLHRGFDFFLGFYNSHVGYYHYQYSNQNMSGYDMHRGDDPAYGLPREYATDLFTDEAIKIIEHHELPRPLYLQISHLAVHAPLESPDEHDDKDFSHIRDPSRRKYARMVVQLDGSVGRIVHALGDKGMLRDSLILFLSDNGAPSIGRLRNWGSNYPLRGTKYTLYEGGVKGVAVLWSPRLHKAARVSNQLIHITDWLPTLYSAAGGDLKDLGDIDGVNQWQVLNTGEGTARDKLLLNIDEVKKTEAAISSRFKLLRGSIYNGYYDGYSGDSGRVNGSLPSYSEAVLKSSVSQGITYHLGGPVTQPSTMMQLRREATIRCHPNMTYYARRAFTTCNVSDCLFDLLNDPCETRNVAEQYVRMTNDLDLFLEHYGRILVKQVRVPVDWLADPKIKNNTWEPWMSPGTILYTPTNTAAVLGSIALCIHIGMPNIIVIVADDLGWNDVGFHGADQIPTPNIDALAYNGVILQRHYVLPTCTPSRTAYLTGRYPIRAGMQGYPLRGAEPRGIPLEDTLLPEHLRNLGYATHLVGKWHVGYHTNHHTPTYRGFDTFFGYYNGYIQYFKHTITEASWTGYDLHYDVSGNLSVEYNYEYITDLIADRAEKIISAHDTGRPLYMQLSHDAPHSSDAEITMEVRDMEEMNSTLGHVQDMNRRRFAGVVTALDESVGRVVSALGRANMLENSIIVFMTDNGAQTEGFLENFGSNYPLRGMKFTLFEGGVRGVACVYSPLIKKSSRVFDQLFHVTDWLPTFYSAAGGNVDDLKNLDGVDQWSAISTESKTKRKSILLNIDEEMMIEAAMIGRFKLVRGANATDNGYYGDSGMDISYPVYDPESILTSPAGSAIANISNPILKSKRIMNNRKRATVLCKSVTVFPSCTNECLFDVYKDPCETTDVSTIYPEIVTKLSAFIESYRMVMMNQTNAPLDPAGAPERHNGVWMPWLETKTFTTHLAL